MWTVLNWLQKHLVWSIPLTMLAGLGFGQVADPGFLHGAILPLTFLMVYPMMVTMNVKELLKPGGGTLQGTTLAINFILMPAIGYAAGLLFFADQPMVRLALLLTALLPTSGMTISWTGFAKGNVPDRGLAARAGVPQGVVGHCGRDPGATGFPADRAHRLPAAGAGHHHPAVVDRPTR
jgi:ACR3 family arsenite efflux pump ArsB